MNLPHTQSRLLSLDVFRGMTIAFMILVNTPGSWSHVYPPLLHAQWHGATPTDMVFPFFLFIVGITLYLSSSRFNHQLTVSASKKILRRTVLIFIIGLLLNWFPFTRALENLRIMGVLQRIAVAYGIGAFICLGLPLRHLWKVGALLLFSYWIMMLAFGQGDPYSLENNLGLSIDRMLLGEDHLYGGFGIKFDPEGLFSSIPAVGTVIFGYYIGYLVKRGTDKHQLVKNLLLIGTVSICAGWVWGIYFPINKPLWTSSYVLYAGGIACCFLAVLIELIDIRGIKNWTRPFHVFGLNPLIIYVLSGLLVKIMLFIIKWQDAASKTRNAYGWLYSDVFAFLLPNQLKLASLLFALTVVALCWLVGYGLYRKHIIIKV